MRSLLLLCIFVIGLTATDPRLDGRNLAGVHQQMLHVSQSLQSYSAQMHQRLTDIPNRVIFGLDACYAAWISWNTTWHSNCSEVGTIWSNETSVADTTTIVENYCGTKQPDGKTCQQIISDSLLVLMTACHDVPSVSEDDLKSFLAAVNVPCVQDTAGDYCFPSFKKLASLQSPITSTDLDGVCTECTLLVLNVLSNWVSSDARQTMTYLSILCTQINGEYCILNFQDLSNSNGDLNMTQTLNLYCNDCTLLVIYKLFNLASFVGDTATADSLGKDLLSSEYLCQKNFQGQYCVSMLMSSKDLNETGPACKTTLETDFLGKTKTCSGSACASQIVTTKSDLGCCFGTWFRMLQYQYVWDNANYKLSPLTPDDLRYFVEDDCGISIPYGCAAQEISALITLENLNSTYYQQNKDAVDAILNATFAYSLAIDAVKITLLTVDGYQTTPAQSASHGFNLLANGQTQAGLQVTMTIQPTTDSETARIQAAVTAINQPGNNPNWLLSSLPLGAKNDQSQPVTVVQASSNAVDNTSAATSNFASFSLLLLLVIVCLF